MSYHLHGNPSKMLKELLDMALSSRKEKNCLSFCISIDSVDSHKCKDCILILILHEPEAVLPRNYRTRLWNDFDKVLVLSPSKPKKFVNQVNLMMPLEISPTHLTKVKSQKNAIVMMNDHKFSASRNSLYGMRRKFLISFEKLEIPHSIYGTNWEMNSFLEIRKRVISVRDEINAHKLPSLTEAFSYSLHRYKNFAGRIDQKFEAFKHFRYGLVIENDKHIVSEKVFDSVLGGLITFYMGPDLSYLGEHSPPVIALPLDFKLALDMIQEHLNGNHDQLIEKIEHYRRDQRHVDYLKPEYLHSKYKKVFDEFLKELNEKA